MATGTVIFPPANCIRFVDMSKVMNSMFNLKHLDDYWISESLLSFQSDHHYKAKAQFFEETWAQFHHDGTHGVDIFLVDCNGTPVSDVTGILRFQVDFAGNIYDNHGTMVPIALHTSTFKVKWQGVGFVDNTTYYIKVEVYYSADKLKKAVYMSEPILYKFKHLNTFALDYSHYINDHGIFWAYIHPTNPLIKWNIVMRLRIDGYLEEFNMLSNDVFYEDQMVDLRLLDSRPYRKQTLFIGDEYGVVDYHIEKIIRAFACSFTMIDNKRFVKENGAKIEISQRDQNQIKTASLELREYFNTDAGVFRTVYDDGSTTPGDTGGGSGGAGSIFITFPTGKSLPLSEYKILTSPEIWEAYAEELSSSLIGFQEEEDEEQEQAEPTYPFGLFGEFSYSVEEGLLYHISPDDLFLPSFFMVHYPEIFTVTAETQPQQSGEFHYKFAGGSHVVDWGDGKVEHVNYNQSGNQFQVVAHEYLSPGTFEVNIYHDNTGMDSFMLEDDELTVTGIEDHIPTSLKAVTIDHADISEFDFVKLEACAAKLQEISIINSNVETLVLDSFDTGNWTGGIKKVDLSGNKLTAEMLDDFLNEFTSKVIFSGAGEMNLSGQDPIAYVTETSAESILILDGFGWKITADKEQEEEEEEQN